MVPRLLAEILLSVVLGAVLLWLFVRMGSSKPPAPTSPLSRGLTQVLVAASSILNHRARA